MKHDDARGLASLLKASSGAVAGYTVKADRPAEPLANFHQWADGRDCCGAFLWTGAEGESLWLVILDWNPRKSGNYYLVVFPESRVGPLAELHESRLLGSDVLLQWQYRPSKHDGKNAQRVSYFESLYGTGDVQVGLPRDGSEVQDFLDDVFALARIRQKADTLDPIPPKPREGFPEGKLVERRHMARERSGAVVELAKRVALETGGCLRCACCGFDFLVAYGELGRGYIEAHHTLPLSDLDAAGSATRAEDLALVCANCHRMLHRRRPWLTKEALTQLLRRTE